MYLDEPYISDDLTGGTVIPGLGISAMATGECCKVFKAPGGRESCY